MLDDYVVKDDIPTNRNCQLRNQGGPIKSSNEQ